MYFSICEFCGASLDPGEFCECRQEPPECCDCKFFCGLSCGEIICGYYNKILDEKKDIDDCFVGRSVVKHVL